MAFSDFAHLQPIVAAASTEGTIRARFNALGGEAFFGPLDRKEAGSVWFFKNGSCLCYNWDLGAAFEIHGAIFAKWLELGGLNWGVPTTDETTTPDGVGRFNHFNGGTASIYWTPTTGACSIYGAIRERWSSLGWERGYLGYPTSDEQDFAEGGRANSFQNGGIYWWPDTGAIDLRDAVVHYTGLHCFGETDWDQSSTEDEPYFIIAVTTPRTSHTVRTQVYGDVNNGQTRPDLLEIYRGPPHGINIGAVLMENDFGDPERYRAEVQTVVDGVHTAGTLALGLIPVVGPVIAAVVGPALGQLMPAIGGEVNKLFDWGDDKIGGANLTLNAKQMVLLATRTENTGFNGIGYKVETPLISGSGASYKAYFGIVPA